MATYQKVIQLKLSDKEDAEFVSYTVKRRIANEKIKHAMEKANDVYNRMEEELIQAKKERNLARNNLVHAIYGVQVGELPKEENISLVLKNVSRSSIFNEHGGSKKVRYNEADPKEPTCGVKGDNGAGFTLINDFYCLCVGKDNDKAVCNAKIKGPGKWMKNDDGNGQCCCCCCEGGKCVKCEKCDCKQNCNCGNGCNCEKCTLKGEWMKMKNETDCDNELGFENGWPHIRKVCEEAVKDKVNTTAKSIQEVLDDFNKLLGKNSSKKAIDLTAGIDMEARRLFILGYTKNMGEKGCNGNGDDEGICVNYWSVSNLGIGIVWQNYMLQAQKHLQSMDRHVQKALRLSTMVQKLKESAEANYRNSTHGSLLWSEDKGFKGRTFLIFFIFLACVF